VRLDFGNRSIAVCVFSLSIAVTFGIADAQNSSAFGGCGKAPIRLDSPFYLTTSIGIVAVELPQGWVLDKTRSNPFFLIRFGEKYESARTLMYVNIERLEVPFSSAIKKDERTFKESCADSRIEDVTAPEILERGCEYKTQRFFCNKKQGAYVDLATKISVGGLLMNVVLSGDNEAETARYKKDHEFLLKHLALVR
jgi:hypothetical protein